MKTSSHRRWHLWLPLAGIATATALVLLAVTAESAFRDRHELALEGRYLKLAHRLEAELRDGGPEVAQEVLERGLAEEPDHVAGLALLDTEGEAVATAGVASGAATRDLELFLGGMWHDGPFRGGAGQGRGPAWRSRAGMMRAVRTLRIVETEAARQRPSAERLLLPAAGVAGAVVVGLALLGGRLLARREEEARREAARRRLEGLGRAGAGLAHQLRTPLATIRGSCQLLLEDAPAETSRRLHAIVGETERMERLLGQLLDYARPPAPEKGCVPLALLFAEIADGEPRVVPADVGRVAVSADPDHLHQILANLVENALEMSPEGQVELTARRRGGSVEITVDDHGPGPGDDPESLFEPYVTRRANGTGLGLPIARALAQANGGELVLLPRDGGGTRALLTLDAAGGER